METIAYELVGHCFVLAVGEQNPSDVEWDAYLSYVRSHVKPGMAPVTLVSTKGGGPTPAQREKLNKLAKELRVQDTLKVAVLTQSAVVRGIVTALSWFQPHNRAFAPTDIETALEFLGMSGATAAQAKLTVPKLHEKKR